MDVSVPVDLRSDTVTRPTPEMRRAMADAEVGDDGFGDDPTVNELQRVFAARVGQEAALFMPSGTMANQVALRVLAEPGSLVIAGRRQHVVTHEGGAFGVNQVAQLHVVDDEDGTLDPAEIAFLVEAAGHRWPMPGVICVENTHLASGGRPWPLGRLEAVAAIGVPVHLDGARMFNASVATGVPMDHYGRVAQTVTCCLSKGLGAPVGSLLAGPAELIDRARHERKRLGGGMRQVGILAAAGLVALETMVDRLADDHARAARLAEAVEARWPGSLIGPEGAAVGDGADGLVVAVGDGADGHVVDEQATTNVVLFSHPEPVALLDHMSSQGVRGVTLGPGVIRFVTHLGVDDAGIDHVVDVVKRAPL